MLSAYRPRITKADDAAAPEGGVLFKVFSSPGLAKSRSMVNSAAASGHCFDGLSCLRHQRPRSAGPVEETRLGRKRRV
jgi:hypothetical protein